MRKRGLTVLFVVLLVVTLGSVALTIVLLVESGNLALRVGIVVLAVVSRFCAGQSLSRWRERRSRRLRCPCLCAAKCCLSRFIRSHGKTPNALAKLAQELDQTQHLDHSFP